MEKCKREGTTKDPSVRGTSAAVSGGTVPFYCDRHTKTHAPTMSKHRRGKLCDGIKNAESDRQYDLKLLADQIRHVTTVKTDSGPCALQSARHEKGQTAARTIREQQKLASEVSVWAVDVNLRVGHRRLNMVVCVRQKRANHPKGNRREPTNRPSSSFGDGVAVKKKQQS